MRVFSLTKGHHEGVVVASDGLGARLASHGWGLVDVPVVVSCLCGAGRQAGTDRERERQGERETEVANHGRYVMSHCKTFSLQASMTA